MSPETAKETVKATLRQVVDSANSQALSRFANLPLRASVAFNLKKLIAKVTEEIKVYDETRSALAEKYGTKSEDGTQYTIREESKADFEKEFTELLNQEIVFDMRPLGLFDLGDGQISIADLTLLDWLIKE